MDEVAMQRTVREQIATPIERATALGTEHGERDARVWWERQPLEPATWTREQIANGFAAHVAEHGELCAWIAYELPEPALTGAYTPFHLAHDVSHKGDCATLANVIIPAYSAAYRTAVEATVRECAEQVTR